MIHIRLSRLLGERKMTQKQLAELTKTQPNTISVMYREKIDRVDLIVLDRICTALNCRPGDLLEWAPGEMERKSRNPNTKNISEQ